jgi:hypothetical protein
MHDHPVIRALTARATSAGTLPGAAGSARVLHLHRYSWTGDDPFSGSSLYRCRCGVVRPGI